MSNSLNNKKLFKSTSMLLILLLLFFSCKNLSQKPGIPSKIEIKHDWQYRWGDSPRDESGVPIWTYEDTTSTKWIDTDRAYSPPGRNGRNFLWLRKRLPDIPWDDPAIFFTNVMMSIEAFVDSQRVYQSGEFKPTPKNRYHAGQWHIFELGDVPQGKMLYLRFFSDEPNHIGIPLIGDNKAFIGTHKSLIRYVITNSIDRFVLGCLFILIGILSIDLFFHRWKQKAYYYLSFATFVIFTGLAFVTSGEVSQFIFTNPKIRFSAATIGLIFFPVGLFSFYEQIVDHKGKKIIRKLWRILLIYGIVLLALQFSGIIYFSFNMYLSWTLVLLVGFAIGIYFGLKGATRGKKAMKIFNVGFVVTILFIIHDLSFVFGIIPYWHWLSQWGVLIFVLCLTHIIEMKNEEDRKKIEKYSQELKEYSGTLEQKVNERTIELTAQNIKLERTLKELRETQAQLVQSKKMASLGQLVAGVAHEVNNPIGAVNSATDVIKRCIKKIKLSLSKSKNINELRGDNNFQKSLGSLEENNQIVSTAGERIADIVRTLKNFARLDEKEIQLADLHEGIESTLTLLHHELKNNAQVSKDFGDIPQINCYPNELNQVFMNLFANAAQAIKNQGTITIKTRSDENYVYIEVSDTGKGIAAEHLDRVFDPGFTTKGVGVGTGLGLSISYNIIQKHRGEIAVESEVGKGTTFSVVLPIKQLD